MVEDFDSLETANHRLRMNLVCLNNYLVHLRG
jgi:hypothetical protein